MLRFLLSALVVAASSSCATTPKSTDPAVLFDQPLHGVWRLLRYETWDSIGRRQTPFGDPPSGYAVFTREGIALIQLMRTMSAPNGVTDADPSQFAAYYGPYTVDSAGGSFSVHVEGMNMASVVATVQQRPFRISGDTLFLGIPGQYQATLIRWAEK